jgi:hypothetical protein
VGIVEATPLLDRSSLLDAAADLRRRDPAICGAHLLVGYRRHLDVQVDAVEKRSADRAQLPLDLRSRTTAFSGGVSQ